MKNARFASPAFTYAFFFVFFLCLLNVIDEIAQLLKNIGMPAVVVGLSILLLTAVSACGMTISAYRLFRYKYRD